MGQDAGVVEGLPELTWSSDHYLLLLFHVGTNNTSRGNLDDIKSDYRALWAVGKGMGTHMVLSSVLLGRGKDVRRVLIG